MKSIYLVLTALILALPAYAGDEFVTEAADQTGVVDQTGAAPGSFEVAANPGRCVSRGTRGAYTPACENPRLTQSQCTALNQRLISQDGGGFGCSWYTGGD